MELLIEHRPVNGYVVYGFPWLAGVSLARRMALRASLTEYRRIHGLQLSGVFKGRRAATEPSPTAFTDLLDASALSDVYGVIVPGLSHLGPKHLPAERTGLVEATGARLLMARRPRIRSGHVPRQQAAHRRFPAPLLALSTES
ncbi:hypothetical protein [Streptomyces parvulus]|uniref:hypothetical protein n=1 Tax=Streptomyces parvulus TaxID=146923 RepID=UPI0033C0B018